MPDLDKIRDSLPAHYDDCASNRSESRVRVALGLSDNECDCTATADVEALLDHIRRQDEQLDSAARTVMSLVDPDGTYAPTPDDPKDLQP